MSAATSYSSSPAGPRTRTPPAPACRSLASSSRMPSDCATPDARETQERASFRQLAADVPFVLQISDRKLQISLQKENFSQTSE